MKMKIVEHARHRDARRIETVDEIQVGNMYYHFFRTEVLTMQFLEFNFQRTPRTIGLSIVKCAVHKFTVGNIGAYSTFKRSRF